MIRLWRRWRALQVMARHERWRVAMDCPGSMPTTHLGIPDARDPIEPRRGEVYCRCARCHAARALVGWDPLP